jgi:hypothetical protein
MTSVHPRQGLALLSKLRTYVVQILFHETLVFYVPFYRRILNVSGSDYRYLTIGLS